MHACFMRYTAKSALYNVICQCNRYYALYSIGHSIQCNTAQGESYSAKCLTVILSTGTSQLIAVAEPAALILCGSVSALHISYLMLSASH